MKDKLLAIYILALFLHAPITSEFLVLTEQESESGQLQNTLIILFIIGFAFFINIYVVGKEKLIKSQKVFLFACALFGIMYLYTSSAYKVLVNVSLEDSTVSGVRHLYMAHFLRWGSVCMTSVVSGMMIMRKGIIEKVGKYIPLFTIVLTILISKETYKGMEMLYGNEFGFNYQNVTYYQASFLILNLYYLFYYKPKHSSYTHKILRLFVGICLLLNIVYIISAGGRGGFIILVVSVVYILLSFLLKGKSNIYARIAIILVVVLAFYSFADFMKLWDSTGFYRVTHMIEIDKGGRELLRELAEPIIEDSFFIGHGLGSVWFTLGYPSHNVIQDVHIELGIIGVVLFIALLLNTIYRLYLLLKKDTKYQLLMLYSFNCIMLLFSGYWISQPDLWFTWGAVYSAMFFSKKRQSN